MILRRYHNSCTTQKSVAVCFKDVETEKTFSSKDQTLVETTDLWQFFFGQKITTAQIRFANDR